MTNRSRGSIIAGVALGAVLVAGGIWFLFLRSDAPPEVDLESATEQVTPSTAADGSTTTTGTVTEPLQGVWVVDNESGEFDFESATGSFAGYRVTEELVNIESSEAVGRTGEVTGSMSIDGTALESVEVTVDLTSLASDEPQRDDNVQSALETQRFPTAAFTLTEPVTFDADAAAGEKISVEAAGELTIHGVTEPVTADLDAQLVDGTAVVVGSIPINLTDFGIEAPTTPMVLSVSNDATIEFQLLFTPEAESPTGPSPTGPAN